MTDGVQRSFYDDGQVRGEVTYLGGLPNGITRHWHPNGVLAAEIPVTAGIVEGVAKQWNEKGELLGTYEVRNGSGKIKNWYANGQLQSEMTVLDGKMTGRLRVWWEDGELSAEEFYIEAQKVSKKKYLEASKKQPELPRYDDLEKSSEPRRRSGRRGTRKPKRKTQTYLAAAIEELLASPESKEALAWLKVGAPASRTLGELPTHKESVGLVTELYSLGAAKVTAVEIHRYETGEENTGKLVITLPADISGRDRIFAWCARKAEELGFDPETETGQQHLFVMLD
jgi:MORN repeat variant